LSSALSRLTPRTIRREPKNIINRINNLCGGESLQTLKRFFLSFSHIWNWGHGLFLRKYSSKSSYFYIFSKFVKFRELRPLKSLGFGERIWCWHWEVSNFVMLIINK
jgi:hypothetical protein